MPSAGCRHIAPRAIEQLARTGDTKDHQAARVAIANGPQTAICHAHPTFAREGKRRFGFKRIAQAQHRNRQFILDDLPHCLATLFPGWKEDAEE
jgi:hypothetical protein